MPAFGEELHLASDVCRLLMAIDIAVPCKRSRDELEGLDICWFRRRCSRTAAPTEAPGPTTHWQKRTTPESSRNRTLFEQSELKVIVVMGSHSAQMTLRVGENFGENETRLG